MDGDGKVDLVVIEQQDSSFLVYLGQEHGAFSAGIPSDNGCLGPTGITLADLDSDGKADAVMVCDGNDTSAQLSAAWCRA